MKLTHPELDAMRARLVIALPEGAEGPLGAVVKDHLFLIDEARRHLNLTEWLEESNPLQQ